MLPGCGISIARDLLQTFGSIERIAGRTPAELCALRGIGPKRAAEIHRVLHAEYRSLDTEKNLEDAIEAAPELLFGAVYSRHRIVQIARQHQFYTDERERHIVDLVFVDETANELLLVELKRGRLLPEHERQLQRYLEYARQSPLLHAVLESGAHMRGMLVTVDNTAVHEPFVPFDQRITAHIVDREAAIDVLVRLRRAWSSAQEHDGASAKAPISTQPDVPRKEPP
jgi:hypothetical protein